MTFNQMLLILPDVPEPVAALAYHHALAENWPRFRDYLQSNGVESLMQRREAFDAALRGHSPSLANAHAVAADAAQGFPNMGCMECAASVLEALQRRGMPGRILDLDTGRPLGMYGDIWSDRLNKVIARNGLHRAVRIIDTVFDNHNPNGIPFDQWRIDHASPGYPNPGEIPLRETLF